MVIGIGQSALIALALCRPRVAELSLPARVVQAEEAQELSPAWHKVRVAILVSPIVLVATSRLSKVRDAVPELFAAPARNEPAWMTLGWRIDNPQRDFQRELFEATGVPESEQIADSVFAAFTGQRDLSFAPAGGQCACGRPAPILSQCRSCVRAEAAAGTEIIVDDEPDEQLTTRPEPGVAAFELDSALLVGPLIFVTPAVIAQLMDPARFSTRHVKVWGRVGPFWTCHVPITPGVVEFPQGSGGSSPYRLLVALSDSGVRVVQHCVDTRFEEVNGIDILKLVTDPAPTTLLAVTSGLWLVFDGGERLQQPRAKQSSATTAAGPPAPAPEWPLLAATHRHRFVRGQIKLNGAWTTLARFSWAYTPEWPAMLARLYSRALAGVPRPAAAPRTAFSARASQAEALTADQVLAAVRPRYKQEPPPSAEDAQLPLHSDDLINPQLVAEGRAEEQEAIRDREQFADEFREGQTEIVPTMRAAIVEDQLRDPEVITLAQRVDRAPKQDTVEIDKIIFRAASDRGLEAAVAIPGKAEAHWVLVLPSGGPRPGLTWKAFFFQHCHVGAFGGHKNSDGTEAMLKRIVWWRDLSRDVPEWIDRCWACLQFRKRVRAPRSFFVTTTRFPWQEVMVDIEGPSSPPDRDGYTYILTYLDLLTGHALLEPLVAIRHQNFRRAFCRAATRSGTFPAIVRSDRGTEIKNLMMFELTALLGCRQRYGKEWRPCEQGPCERAHVTSRRRSTWHPCLRGVQVPPRGVGRAPPRSGVHPVQFAGRQRPDSARP